MSRGKSRARHRFAQLVAICLVGALAGCSNSDPAGGGSSGAPGSSAAAGAQAVSGAGNGVGGAGTAGAVSNGGTSGIASAAGNTAGGSVASAGQAGAGGGGNATAGSGGNATAGSGGTSGSAGSAGAGGSVAGGSNLPPFILGADITVTIEDVYWGATYTDAGMQKPLEQVLKDHGFNFIRIDTFVDPGAPGGYAETKEEAFRDLAHTTALAKRVKAIGMGFLLDLHYSDTWTNPGAQKVPAAWAGLSPSQLETKVYEYTKDAVTQLKAQSAKPDIVQIGNEITSGMLWEAGKVSGSDFAGLATLLKAGIRAVREVDPTIHVMLHIEKCHNLETSQWWLDGVLGAGVKFDILGQSCYATAPNGVAGYQGTPQQWQATFAALAQRYPDLKFIIAEYSAEQRAANDTMFNLPNRRGLGTFNWDPTSTYATHPNQPLFTTDGAWNKFVAIPELMALYEKMAQDYGLR